MPDSAMLYSVPTMPTNSTHSELSQNVSFDHSTNVTDSEIRSAFSGRFYGYTVLLCGCLFFNTLSLLAMSRMRARRSVHHTLLFNLAITDIFGSVLLWMYYNSPYIFPRFEIVTLPQCLFIVAVLVGPFILALSTSALSLLTLALNQYIAICHPLRATTSVTKHKATIVIAMIWVFSLTLAMIPALLVISQPDCYMWTGVVGVKALEICSYGLAILVIIIVSLYGRIYREIIGYRKRMPQLGRNSGHSSEQEHNYKAFITTLLLTGTLIIFWIPYTAFHFLSAHVDIDNIPLYVIYMKLYVIDFLPLLNYITDPIIYGIRMREVRDGYRRLFRVIMPCCVKAVPFRARARSSVRFSTIDTTTL